MAARFEGSAWLISIFFRFIWACLPQSGYIHPDEFFQATEITAGDVLEYKHFRTWEFNETFPVRTVSFPYIFSGLPFYLLKKVFGPTFISSTMLITTPRLVMTALSLIIDFSTYVICIKLQMDPASSLCLLGTSFVTLVFYTRSFSNSLESTLFAVLLVLVVSSIFKSNKPRTGLAHTEYFLMGITFAAGIWNRPTFVAFACVPLIGWLLDFWAQQWTGQDKVRGIILRAVGSVIFVALGTFLTAFILTIVDSYYFGYLARGDFVLTPLNFLRYNLNTNSLHEHGLHPRFTHFIVNMPLLFGPLAVVLFTFTAHAMVKKNLLKSGEFVTNWKTSMQHKSELVRRNEKASYIWSMLLWSIFTPMAMLSLIPHQEPRFMIPVLVPLVILFSKYLVGPSATHLAKLLWFSWNVLGCILFGVLHQGGLCSCLGYLQEHLSSGLIQSSDVTYHLTFYHTYMPPQHLLTWHHDNNQNLVVHDLHGNSRDMLRKHLDIISSHNMSTIENNETRLEVRMAVMLCSIVCFLLLIFMLHFVIELIAVFVCKFGARHYNHLHNSTSIKLQTKV